MICIHTQAQCNTTVCGPVDGQMASIVLLIDSLHRPHHDAANSCRLEGFCTAGNMPVSLDTGHSDESGSGSAACQAQTVLHGTTATKVSRNHLVPKSSYCISNRQATSSAVWMALCSHFQEILISRDFQIMPCVTCQLSLQDGRLYALELNTPTTFR